MIIYEYVCVKCGAHHLSGEEHKCAQNIKPKRKPSAKPVPQTASSSSPSPSSRRIETVKPPEPVRPLDTALDLRPLDQWLDMPVRPPQSNAPAFDKRAYQRDYMRKRRAAARQKAPE